MLSNIEEITQKYHKYDDGFWSIQVIKFQKDTDLVSKYGFYVRFKINEIKQAIKTVRLIRDGLIDIITETEGENGGYDKIRNINEIKYVIYEFNGAINYHLMLSITGTDDKAIKKMISHLY